jgi:hypothetical protein
MQTNNRWPLLTIFQAFSGRELAGQAQSIAIKMDSFTGGGFARLGQMVLLTETDDLV